MATEAVDQRVQNRFGRGEPKRSGTGRGFGYHDSEDALSGPEASFKANAPLVLCMAPKKEKGGTATTGSKTWEPSLIAAQFNQVCQGPINPLCPLAVLKPGQTLRAKPPGSLLFQRPPLPPLKIVPVTKFPGLII